MLAWLLCKGDPVPRLSLTLVKLSILVPRLLPIWPVYMLRQVKRPLLSQTNNITISGLNLHGLLWNCWTLIGASFVTTNVKGTLYLLWSRPGGDGVTLLKKVVLCDLLLLNSQSPPVTIFQLLNRFGTYFDCQDWSSLFHLCIQGTRFFLRIRQCHVHACRSDMFCCHSESLHACMWVSVQMLHV